MYTTLSKENLELYFLFLYRELGSVSCWESSFCASVYHDKFSHINSTFIAESPTGRFTFCNFFRLLMSMYLHVPHVSNFHGIWF